MGLDALGVMINLTVRFKLATTQEDDPIFMFVPIAKITAIQSLPKQGKGCLVFTDDGRSTMVTDSFETVTQQVNNAYNGGD